MDLPTTDSQVSDLREIDILYLEDATPIVEQVITDFPSWQSMPVHERECIIRLTHDHEIGEDWENTDTWQDVNFTKEEINAISKHILVEGDNGQPEWHSTIA
ncbi:hypothetical protein [Xanthocytophaga flava]|uniref:hypothetical protein n=1 Tax=Xanthocytophaga flava TaxID=3048013 RepID=UPI0028D51D83|nr:hypothetical protein [Xanthocytophaga flavus]MDJ1470270.1 hypothetical protein [Xanthocytophaga flavus]